MVSPSQLASCPPVDIDRIPPEILCDIFLAALPHPTNRREYLSSVVAPLRISHVCRSWRTLSLSFGELWSYLCIECGFSCRNPAAGMDLEAKVSVLDTWIERTNGAPLNFRVECFCSTFDTAEHRLAEHIITTMISQQHRWRDVTFTWLNVKLSPEFPGINLTNMPILTSLALNVVLPPRARINIAQCSRLRRLRVRAPDFDLMTGEEPLCSFTESAEIDFSYASCSGSHMLRVWLDVLKAAPFLTEFISDFYQCTDQPLPRAQNEPPIQLPNLRVLKLRKGYCASDPVPFIVDYVTLPNLQVLFYASNGRNYDMKAAILTNFIRRSLPPLTTLVMVWDDVREEFIIPMLRLLPALKYLRLRGAKVTGRFFDELTVPNNTGSDSLPEDEDAIVCPVLETIYLHRVDLEEDTDWWIAFMAMLKSRPRGLGKSDVIYLKDYRSLSPTVISVLGENTRREVSMHVRGDGVVIGNYEDVESHLLLEYWENLGL